jgi:hypothetical protein
LSPNQGLSRKPCQINPSNYHLNMLKFLFEYSRATTFRKIFPLKGF